MLLVFLRVVLVTQLVTQSLIAAVHRIHLGVTGIPPLQLSLVIVFERFFFQGKRIKSIRCIFLTLIAKILNIRHLMERIKSIHNREHLLKPLSRKLSEFDAFTLR